jgi:hypothetical protein
MPPNRSGRNPTFSGGPSLHYKKKNSTLADPLTKFIYLERILKFQMNFQEGKMTSEKVLSVSKDEFDNVLAFIEEKKNLFPPEIYTIIKNICYLYNSLLAPIEKGSSMLDRLREAMRIVPRTEKGSSALGKFLWWKTIK